MLTRSDLSLVEVALSFWVTLGLLVMSAASLILRYVARPIVCLTPPQFHLDFSNYAHHICFQQTEIYIIPDHVDISLLGALRQFTYHHWVPFYLGIAAIGCLAPYVIWRMLSSLLWLDAHVFAQSLGDNQRQNAASRHVNLRDSALVLRAGLKGNNWLLTVGTLFRKALVGLVCLVQLVLIVVYWEPQTTASEHGHKQVGETNSNHSLPLPYNFYCDFRVRMMQQIQAYTLQCNLPFTPVFRKGFTFLFYVFLLLLLCSIADVLMTLCRVGVPGLRDISIRRYVNVGDPSLDPHLSAILPRFLDTLGMDGYLILAITADYCGPLAAADLTNHLWQLFRGGVRPQSGAVNFQAPPSNVASAPPSSSQEQGQRASTRSAGPDDSSDAIPLVTVGQDGKERPV